MRISMVVLALMMLLGGLGTHSSLATPNGSPYIIVFHNTVDVHSAAPALEKAYGLQTGFRYQHALKGMSAVVTPGRLAALEKDPRVAYVVEDMVRTISAQTVPTGIKRICADSNGNITIDGVDDYRVDVDVAVIDTCVDFDHPDLNVVGGVNCSGGGTDTPPTVSISSPVYGATFESGSSISFAGSATDTDDGDLTASLVWTSNLDGQIGTGGSFSAVLSDGTHTITAQVTDSGGNSSSDSISITVNSGDPGGDSISLSVSAYKVKGTKYADLTWSGAISTNVDIYRNGSLITTTNNDGAYTDGPLGKGGGSATYQVCEAGTTTCLNSVSVGW